MLVSHLRNALQTQIPDTDPVRADIVKMGMFQEKPTRADTNVSVWVSTGDPSDLNAYDGVVTTGSIRDIGASVPPREIGGATYWWRRLTAQFGVYFVKSQYTEEQAASLASEFYGRLLQACGTYTPHGTTDDFNETALNVFTESARLFESGGIKKSTYIWRGSVALAVMTARR